MSDDISVNNPQGIVSLPEGLKQAAESRNSIWSFFYGHKYIYITKNGDQYTVSLSTDKNKKATFESVIECFENQLESIKKNEAESTGKIDDRIPNNFKTLIKKYDAKTRTIWTIFARIWDPNWAKKRDDIVKKAEELLEKYNSKTPQNPVKTKVKQGDSPTSVTEKQSEENFDNASEEEKLFKAMDAVQAENPFEAPEERDDDSSIISTSPQDDRDVEELERNLFSLELNLRGIVTPGDHSTPELGPSNLENPDNTTYERMIEEVRSSDEELEKMISDFNSENPGRS